MQAKRHIDKWVWRSVLTKQNRLQRGIFFSWPTFTSKKVISASKLGSQSPKVRVSNEISSILNKNSVFFFFLFLKTLEWVTHPGTLGLQVQWKSNEATFKYYIWCLGWLLHLVMGGIGYNLFSARQSLASWHVVLWFFSPTNFFYTTPITQHCIKNRVTPSTFYVLP